MKAWWQSCGPWWAILLAALVLRLGAAAWWQSRLPADAAFAFPDSESYWKLAATIAHGEPYVFGERREAVFRSPGYPLLLSPLFRIWNEPPIMAARVQSALCGTAAVAAVGWLALRLFDRSTALVAALLAAMYPGAISMSIVVLSEALFCPLMVCQLAAWASVFRATTSRQRLVWAGVCGGLGGLAALVRPSWLLFTPFAATACAALAGRAQQRPLWSLCMLASLCCVMFPWWMRNYHVTGEFVPTTLQVGASLYDGLSPQATGASEMSFVPHFERQQRLADAASADPLKSTFEWRLDNRMRRAALAWAGAHPAEATFLAWVKFKRLWSPVPNAAEFQGGWLRLVTALGYVPVLLAALWGVRRCWQSTPAAWLCVLPAVYFTLLHVVFVSSIRYREPAMLALLVLAATTVVSLAPRNQGGRCHS